MVKLTNLPPIPRLSYAPSLDADGHELRRFCNLPSRAMRDALHSVYSSSADSYFILADEMMNGDRMISVLIFKDHGYTAKARVNHSQ